MSGVYLHIPFCKSRCSYCDFATDVYRDSDAVERYVNALCEEISGSTYETVAADTIYFGGGTPSLLTPKQVGRILTKVHAYFEISQNAEVTMEMNPATLTLETLAAYRELGINRASFGVQTFNDRDLRLLARGHNATDARETFRLLRDAGFDNISFDLIAGLPGQTLEDSVGTAWTKSLHPEDLNAYLDTFFTSFRARQEFQTEFRMKRADGAWRRIYCHGIPTYKASGTFAGYIGTCMDVTERKG